MTWRWWMDLYPRDTSYAFYSALPAERLLTNTMSLAIGSEHYIRLSSLSKDKHTSTQLECQCIVSPNG